MIDKFLDFIFSPILFLERLIRAFKNQVRKRKPGEIYLVYKNGKFDYLREPDPDYEIECKAKIANSKINYNEGKVLKKCRPCLNFWIDEEGERHDLFEFLK